MRQVLQCWRRAAVRQRQLRAGAAAIEVAGTRWRKRLALERLLRMVEVMQGERSLELRQLVLSGASVG